MTIQAVLTGLKTRADTIAGLTAYEYQPSSPVYPAAFPTLPEIDYHRAMQGGLREIDVNLVILLNAAEEKSRTSILVEYLEPTGAKSIFAAIEADTTLGGAAQDLIVRQFVPFGIEEIALMKAIGGVFPIHILLA